MKTRLNISGYYKQLICWLVVLRVCGCDEVCDRRPLGTKTEPLPPDNRFQIEILDIYNNQYIPNKNYTVRLFSMDGVSTFIAFTISARGDTKPNERNHRKPIPLSPGQIRPYPDSHAVWSSICENTVIQKDVTAKTSVQVEWRAPPKDQKCVTIYVVLAVVPDVWYNYEGPLSKQVCEDRRNMEDMQPMENGNCEVCEDAQYLLTFEGIWSCHTHPLLFPKHELAASPHFSDVVGASHNKNYNVFKVYSDASEALKMLAEQGNTTKLEMEMINLVGVSVRTVIKASGQPRPNMVTHSIFRVSREHHLVSLVTAIIPSPDWFLGVSNMELCEVNTNKWATNLTLNLYPLDAGTDSGIKFDSPNEDTMPPKPISSAVINKSVSKEQFKPFARLHFNLMRTYPTIDCETSTTVYEFTDNEEKPEVSIHYVPSEISPTTAPPPTEEFSPDPDTSEECPMTAWEEWEPCAGECIDNVYIGYKTRSRYYLVDGVAVGKDLDGPDVEVPEECFNKYSDHETAPCEEECEEEETVIRYSN
ncbi:spondin-2-like [Bicyclus anynana]|uniref:Spondin-2-like n=1 Tax=Bicyclus anynana TaxID=110368 RepID=A0A6J1PB79_BICAN|nr:spondin-2-like [Bicyclus anynana]